MAFSFKLRRQLTNASIRSIPEDSVEYYALVQVQERLLKVYEEEPDIFDKSDVEKIVNSKSYLRRFAQRREGNVDKTFEMVKNTLIWRKENQLPKITDKLIPKEFYDLGICLQKGTDHEGNLVFHVRAKFAIFNDKVKTALHRYFAFYLFKIVEESIALHNDKGWTLCADLTGISIAQYDLPEILWVLKVVVDYMPAGLRSIIAYNLPWFAKPFVKLVLNFVPGEWKRIIHIVGHKELLKLIPKESIPRYIDYPKEAFSAPAPPDTKPLSEIDVSLLDTKKEDLLDFFESTILRIN